MEILDATLKELEAKERNYHDLQEIYVKKLFPSFQEEFKNYAIHDIQNYENYNLQNILDDLRHIQMLLEESPDEKRFLAKKEFLVKLSQKILKKIQNDHPTEPPASSKPENNKSDAAIQLPIIRKQKQTTIVPKKEQPKPERKSLTVVQDPVMAKEPEKVEPKVEEKPIEQVVPPVEPETKKEPVKVVKEPVKVEPKPVKERIEPKIEPKVEEKVKPEEPAKKEEKVEQPAQVQVEEKEPVKEVKEAMVELEEDVPKQKEPKNIVVKKVEKVQRPSSQDKKKRPISSKRKKSLPGREKLIQINEEAVNEESGEEAEEKDVVEDKPKKKMEFSLEQEKQIQEMSAQYGVEVEALKSYLETKAAHNQFNWMGIKRLERKVDINLEISKLEFEYERFVKRKNHYRSLKHVVDIAGSPDSLPYLSRSQTTLHQHQKSLPQNKSYVSYYPGEKNRHKDPKSMTFGGEDMDWGAIDENFAEAISNSLPGSPRSFNRLATIESLPLTRDNSKQEQVYRNQGTLLQSKNVQEDHWSEVSYAARSKGQVKLPSITSFNPSKKQIPTQTTVNAISFDLGDDSTYRRLNSTSEPNIGSPASIISPSYKGQIKMKRNSSSGYVHLPGLGEHRMMLNRIDTKISIEDSMSGELTGKHKEYREPMSAQAAGANFEKKLTGETRKGLSQMNTTRSNYLMSLNSLAKPDYADSVVIDGFSTLRSTTGRTNVQLQGRDEYQRYNQDMNQLSRKGTEEVRGDSESFAMGATMQTISTKSMTSVYSQEQPSRFMSLRSMGSGMRVVEGDLEYYGTVKRINLLGSGSQAKVFLCEVKEFENLVALKQYDANKSQYGGQSYEALKDEFHMLRQLDQENVIQYYCLYRSKRKTFSSFVEFGVIMEYMPGGSLEKYIETSFSSITMKTKRSFIKQILKGLDCLHSNKIIHRDLKPGNILLSDDQSLIKISDFGISTQTKEDDMAKSIVGTPWYMAPEIINEEAYSYKADIWSAGCCFLHLLTGNKPYHMANARQAMLLMANHDTPLETCDEESIKMIESYKGLKELLQLCFSKDKGVRASAAQLLESPFFSE